jgi:hypothetical protein
LKNWPGRKKRTETTNIFQHGSSFVVMLFAQFSGQNGLRSIENSFNSQGNLLYHLGIAGSEVFKKLFYRILENVPRNNQKKFAFKNPFYAVDATVIGLCMNKFPMHLFVIQILWMQKLMMLLKCTGSGGR